MKSTLTCPACGTVFTQVHASYRTPMYCSRTCAMRARAPMSPEARARVSAAASERRGEKNANWRGGEVEKTCGWCSGTFSVPQNRATTALYCSRSCKGKADATKVPRGEESPRYTWGANLYQRNANYATATQCAWCGWTRNLVTHHRDQDHRSNGPENLVVICKSCHQRWHHAGRWLLTGAPNGRGHHKPPRPGQPGTPEFPEKDAWPATAQPTHYVWPSHAAR